MRASAGGDCQEPQGPTILSPQSGLKDRERVGEGKGIKGAETTAGCLSHSAVETVQTGR